MAPVQRGAQQRRRAHRIDTAEALRAALHAARSVGPRRFAVRLPALSARENAAVESRLNQLASGCGCGEAAGASVAFSAAYLGWVWGHGVEASGGALVVAGIVLALFLLGGAVGKLAGLARLRWLTRRLIDRTLASRASAVKPSARRLR